MSRPTLEVSMIVKNGAATLRRSLDSLATVADRILIGDTGSNDETMEIARACGAEVMQIPWEDDFSLARNRVLAAARCDWILVIDADEMLDASGPSKLAALLDRPEVDAYNIVRWNYVRSATTRSGENPPLPNPGLLPETRAYPAYAISVNTRLFRRSPEVYFEYSVHETVASRLDALGRRRVLAEDFVIHHFGQAEDESAVRETKNELYHRLGLKKIADHPELAEGWFEVGLSELEHFHRPAVALKYFEQASALDPETPRNHLFCGICLTATGKLNEALAQLDIAYRRGLRSAVLFEAVGDVYFQAGRYQQALAAYSGGGYSPLNTAKLGASETMLGATATGLKRIQTAIQQCPNFAELYDILTAAAAEAGDYALAANSADERLQVGSPRPEHYQLAAEMRAQAVKQSARKTGMASHAIA